MKHEIEYRGKDLIAKLAKTKVVVCGAGALGSNLIDSLARVGFTQLKVIDFDRVEGHNINNQVYDLGDVGNLKVTALQRKVYASTKVKLEAENKKLEATNVVKLLKDYDIVVDCFDNSASRKIVTQYCLKSKTQCIHSGLVDDYGEVVWNENYNVPQEVNTEAVCDYPLARNLVAIVTAMTCEEIINYIAGKPKKNLAFSLLGMKVFNVA